MHPSKLITLAVCLPRSMIQKAFQWAEANGRKRKNAIHGEDEIQIVLSETFELKDLEIEEQERSGSLVCEERGSRFAACNYILHNFKLADMFLNCTCLP